MTEAIKPTRSGMTWEQVFGGTVRHPEFTEQVFRLMPGVKLSVFRTPRSPIEAMIDQSAMTEEDRQKEAEEQALVILYFMYAVWDLVWCRLALLDGEDTSKFDADMGRMFREKLPYFQHSIGKTQNV